MADQKSGGKTPEKGGGQKGDPDKPMPSKDTDKGGGKDTGGKK
jgi:hypothetical protein